GERDGDRGAKRAAEIMLPHAPRGYAFPSEISSCRLLHTCVVCASRHRIPANEAPAKETQSMNFTPPSAKERTQALDLALQQIEKQFGKGAIMKLGEGNAAPDIETISTGSIGLDLALGVGGVPRGRVIEIYGPESSGKTTLALTIIANA